MEPSLVELALMGIQQHLKDHPEIVPLVSFEMYANTDDTAPDGSKLAHPVATSKVYRIEVPCPAPAGQGAHK